MKSQTETIKSEICTHVKDLMNDQRPHIQKAIQDNKWYRSEERGYDIGDQEAEFDFINKHLYDWCAGFKVCYCNYVCPNKDNCKMKEAAGK